MVSRPNIQEQPPSVAQSLNSSAPTGFWPNQPPFLVVTVGNLDGSTDLTFEKPPEFDTREDADQFARAEAKRWKTLGFAVYELRLVSFHGAGARKWRGDGVGRAPRPTSDADDATGAQATEGMPPQPPEGKEKP